MTAARTASMFAAGCTGRSTARRAAGRISPEGFYGDYITYCGARGGCGTHNGYDYGVPVGTPLYAVAPGVVDAVHAADSRSAEYGNAGLWVRVRHDASTVAGLERAHYVAYLHLSRILVSVGDAVTTTTVLGLSGNTGNVAAHLHLHVSTSGGYCAGPVDPGCPTRSHVNGSVIPGFAGAPGCEGVCGDVPVLWVQPAAYGGEAYRKSNTPAPPPPDPCTRASDCRACASQAACGWCGPTGSCRSGGTAGAHDGSCSGADWTWRSAACGADYGSCHSVTVSGANSGACRGAAWRWYRASCG